MIILYVSGYSRMVLFNKLIPKALQANGYDVIEYDWNSVLAFNKYLPLLSNASLKKKRNENLLEKVKEHSPDIIFILKGEPYTTETLAEIKKISGAKLINWFGDDPWEFPLFSGLVCNYYDYFFTYDPYSVKLYHHAGYKSAYHLPYGYDPEIAIHLPLSQREIKKYSCDISFIGSHYPEREVLLNQLKKKYDVKIWGRGWKKSSCEDIYQGNALYGYDMLKAMKCSSIILNLHKGYNQGVEASGEGLNLRVMEASACGSFQISNAQNDIPNRFEVDKEIVLFQNDDELKFKIEFYLQNKDKRMNIAVNSHKRLKKDHTLVHRMKEMMDIVLQ